VSPPTATASARRRSPRGSPVSRRKAAARRRRRRAIIVVALGLLAIVGVVRLLPLAQRAVNDLSLPLSYPSIIRRQAAEKHLDPALVAAIIYAETKFDPRTSSAGAEGLMQLMPQTATFLAHRTGGTTFTTADLATPQVNIAYGSYYIRYLLNEFHGNLVAALAAYNGGDANVHKWIAQAQAEGHSFRIADIPFPETRDYVQRVLQARRNYRHTYAAQLGYG
jgi:soluble lytic murein transglycosylase